MLRHTDGVVLSHWHTLFEDFSTSTQEFYRAVEGAVRARHLPEVEISRVLFKEGGVGTAEREYLRVSRKRVAFDICSAPYGNGHFFSWWLAKIPAKYGLLVVAGYTLLGLFVWSLLQLVFLSVFRDTCFGAAFSGVLFVLGIPAILLGLGFMVERGMIGDEEWVLSIPWVGYLYAVVFNPTTYYRQDTAMMFRDSIRSAVNEVINSLRTEKGLRGLGEQELAPEGEGPA